MDRVKGTGELDLRYPDWEAVIRYLLHVSKVRYKYHCQTQPFRNFNLPHSSIFTVIHCFKR